MLASYKAFTSFRNMLKSFEVPKNNFCKYVFHQKPSFTHVIARRHYKSFMQIENKYAYEMLQSKGHLKRSQLEKTPETLRENIVDYLKQDWNKKCTQELCEVFGTISMYCSENNICISNKIFDNFIDAFTDHVKHFTDKQLEEAFLHLKLWPETPTVKTRNFIEVWAALDDACIARYKKWNADEKLRFANLTYETSIAKSCDFTFKAVKHLTTRASTLTVSQLLQTTFLISVMRSSPSDKHNLELYLEKNKDHFTIDDLSIMAMGFFKSKSPIRNAQLIKMMIEKVISNKEELDNIPLAAFFKLVRYSYRVTDEKYIYWLLTEFEGQISRLSVTACVHYALIGSSSLILHKTSLSQIIERVVSDISDARLKDLERLVLVLATLNFQPENVNFVNLVIDEFRKPGRKAEIETYGKTLCTCLMYCTILGYYPHDLINQCLDPKFIEMSYGTMALLGRELLVLHNTVQIHCPEYSGHLLPQKTVKFLANSNTDYVPNENYEKQYNVTEMIVLDVVKHLENIMGDKKYVCGDHAVPHYQRGDIFLCKDKEGNPVDISEHFPIKPFGQIKSAPTQDNWVALIIAARNAFIRGTENLTGPFVAKCRDLRKIGYHPVIVSHYDWVKLNNSEEKIEYLQKLIKDSNNT